jgi:hypothetical protein
LMGIDALMGIVALILIEVNYMTYAHQIVV